MGSVGRGRVTGRVAGTRVGPGNGGGVYRRPHETRGSRWMQLAFKWARVGQGLWHGGTGQRQRGISHAKLLSTARTPHRTARWTKAIYQAHWRNVTTPTVTQHKTTSHFCDVQSPVALSRHGSTSCNWDPQLRYLRRALPACSGADHPAAQLSAFDSDACSDWLAPSGRPTAPSSRVLIIHHPTKEDPTFPCPLSIAKASKSSNKGGLDCPTAPRCDN